jgi:hypothetical protein
MVPNHAFTKVASGAPGSSSRGPIAKSGAAQRAPIEAARWRVCVGCGESRFAFLKVVVRHAARGDVDVDRVKAGPAVKAGQESIGRGKKVSNSTLSWLRVHGSRATLVADHRSRQAILKWVSRGFEGMSCPAITTGSCRWIRFAGGSQCRVLRCNEHGHDPARARTWLRAL